MTTQLTVLLPVFGFSDVFSYFTDSRAVSYCAFVAFPLSVNAPVVLLNVPVIPFAAVNDRTSSPPALNPELIVIVAPAKFALSTSAKLSVESINTAPSFSV